MQVYLGSVLCKSTAQVCICSLSYLCPDGKWASAPSSTSDGIIRHVRKIRLCCRAQGYYQTTSQLPELLDGQNGAQDMFGSTRAVCIVCTYCNWAPTKCPGAHPQPIVDCKYAPHTLLTSKRFGITPFFGSLCFVWLGTIEV